MRRLIPLVLLFGLWVPAARAWTWPVQGPVVRAFAFDPAHPYDGGQHRGVDIGAAAGAPVAAPASGTVAFAGTVPTSGLAVTIDTAGGLAVTLTHLGTIAVARGDAVVEGEVVGTIGPSGAPEVDVPYLHLGIRPVADENGYLDPLSLLPAASPVAAPTPDRTAPPVQAATPGAGEVSPPEAVPPVVAPPVVAPPVVAPLPAAEPSPLADSPPAESANPSEGVAPPATPPAPVRSIPAVRAAMPPTAEAAGAASSAEPATSARAAAPTRASAPTHAARAGARSGIAAAERPRRPGPAPGSAEPVARPRRAEPAWPSPSAGRAARLVPGRRGLPLVPLGGALGALGVTAAAVGLLRRRWRPRSGGGGVVVELGRAPAPASAHTGRRAA